MSTEDVVIRREGRAGRLTMNRPQALNALTTPMVGMITAALSAWRDDPGVELVVLDGAGGRALCAGGDVVSLYHSRGQGSGVAREFWSTEYVLNALIGRYPKPFVAFQDGIVMGGGIGLSGHASHRIVTERSMLAMPETGIGLIPDVGGTWLLSHGPGAVGIYLGLTGHRMTGSDAIFARFADRFVESARLPALAQALATEGAGAIDDVIGRFAASPPPSALEAQADAIDQCFESGTVEAILAALSRHGSAWASKIRADLEAKSPKSMKVTLAAIRQARTLPSLEAALDVEYRLCTRLFEEGEFPEGVRALLVEKDKAPKWRPGTLAEVTGGEVARLMAPLPPGEELGLAATV